MYPKVGVVSLDNSTSNAGLSIPSFNSMFLPFFGKEYDVFLDDISSKTFSFVKSTKNNL